MPLNDEVWRRFREVAREQGLSANVLGSLLMRNYVVNRWKLELVPLERKPEGQ